MCPTARKIFRVVIFLVLVSIPSIFPRTMALTSSEKQARLIDQAVTEKVIDGMVQAISQVQSDGDTGRFLASMVDLQTEAIDRLEVTTHHLKDSKLRDFTSSLLAERTRALKEFNNHRAGYSSLPLNAAQSRSFSRLMADVLASLREDLTDCGSSATEEEFLRVLVAHHAASIDIAKIFLVFEENRALRSVVADLLLQQQIELKALRNWET